MPDPISWYALGKEILDPTTIDEEIDAKILIHNLDASAHGQSDEAVYNHRISELLDHVNYSIYNIKMHPETRTVKAFVAAGGACEFSTLQEAIDYVHALGGGKIFVKDGTYQPKSDITLYTDVSLEGEDNDTVIIDFENAAYRIKCIGTSILHNRNILVENIQVKNSKFATWGQTMYFQYCDDVEVRNCKFTNNVGTDNQQSAIFFDECVRCRAIGNYSVSDGIGVSVSFCTKSIVRDNDISGAKFRGIDAEGGTDNLIEANRVYNSLNAAIFLEATDKTKVLENYIDTFTSYGVTTGENNPSSYLLIANNHILNGSVNSTAIYIDLESQFNNVIGNVLYNNAGENIYVGMAFYNTITGNIVTAGDRGVYLTSDASNNIVIGNVLAGNNTAITNDGADNTVDPNITA